jgi:hypothetical protein
MFQFEVWKQNIRKLIKNVFTKREISPIYTGVLIDKFWPILETFYSQFYFFMWAKKSVSQLSFYIIFYIVD